jgi:hypothetical protein
MITDAMMKDAIAKASQQIWSTKDIIIRDLLEEIRETSTIAIHSENPELSPRRQRRILELLDVLTDRAITQAVHSLKNLVEKEK